MADDEDRIKALEGRIAELENTLAGRSQKKVEDLTEEEMATFKKVQDVLATDWGEFCGINDCFRCRVCVVCRVCQVCQVCRVCKVCDVECSCGPCNVGGFIGGIGGFNQFGG